MKNPLFFFFDLRQDSPPQKIYSHQDVNEVCKVRFSNLNEFVISGGNDNRVIIYDIRKASIINNFGINSNDKGNYFHRQLLSNKELNNSFRHRAAIKGLDFNIAQDILVSGGGTNDKIIKIWDLKKLCFLDQHQTDSQVSNVNFLQNDSFLVSSGYISNDVLHYKFDYSNIKFSYFGQVGNDLTNLRTTCSYEKHKKRILFMAKAKFQDYFVTCSADGNLKLFDNSNIIDKDNFANNVELR